MPCIFCPSEDDLTDEHVFPAFMGGKLEVKDGSCERCNGDFGEAEAAVKQATAPLLNLLKIRNRKGVVPNIPLKADIRGLDMKKLPAFMDGAGEIRLHDTVTESRTADGKIIRHGFFLTEEGGDKFVKRSLAKGGRVIEKAVPEKIVIDADYTQTTRFAFSAQARKVAAKIALASVAFEYGIPFALSADFDVIREARTATGDKDLRVWIFSNQGLMGAYGRTAHHHSVMCYLSAYWRKAWAVVTLFGGLTYRVDLATEYTGREKQFGIFYDAVSRKRINPVVLADEKTLIGHVLSPATTFENRDTVDAQWFPLLSAFCAEKGIEVSRIVEDSETHRETP
jgi:hypothetical protein